MNDDEIFDNGHHIARIRRHGGTISKVVQPPKPPAMNTELNYASPDPHGFMQRVSEATRAASAKGTGTFVAPEVPTSLTVISDDPNAKWLDKAILRCKPDPESKVTDPFDGMEDYIEQRVRASLHARAVERDRKRRALNDELVDKLTRGA